MNVLFRLRRLLGFMLLCLACSAWGSNAGAAKRPFNPAPSADLAFLVKAKQSGFTIDGSSAMAWHAGERRYSIRMETRSALLGKVLTAGSEGAIDDFGLAPETFTEKRIRRDAASASFDRTGNTISFATSRESYPIQGGEQDRSSILWQLIGHARAAPKKFIQGSEWSYFVVGPQDADTWIFKVGRGEKIETALGAYDTVRISRVPNERGHVLEFWLAPALGWYPVRIRQTETDGDYIEQTLESVSRK